MNGEGEGSRRDRKAGREGVGGGGTKKGRGGGGGGREKIAVTACKKQLQ